MHFICNTAIDFVCNPLQVYMNDSRFDKNAYYMGHYHEIFTFRKKKKNCLYFCQTVK